MSILQRDGLTIDWLCGNCPVQAEGTVDGKPFYFRARWDEWSLRIGGRDPVGNPEWRYDEVYEIPFSAGWMTDDEAIRCIEKAVAKWREETRTEQ